MDFNVFGTLEDGLNVFAYTSNFIPSVGKEIEVNGCIFEVLSVRCVVDEGPYDGTTVYLLVEQVK